MNTKPYKPYEGRRRHLWLKVLLALVLTAVLVFAGLEVYIAVHSRTQIMGQPQTMVIFGCQMKQDGPSVLLRDRLDTALTYLEGHPDMTVIVTGGKGDDEHQSEAQGMYDYLTAHGVDGKRIYKEDQSRNTWQNVNYTLDLMEKEGMELTQDVVLVSNGFHLSRIQLLWDRARNARLAGETYRDQYISTLAAPVSHAPSAVQMFFREPLALVKSALFDR